MLVAAQEKASELGLAVDLFCSDICTLDLDRSYDAALMMFAVLGYQTGNADVAAALTAARRHLEPGGLLVLDVWYGPAVLSQRPADRVKLISAPNGTILRAASGELDVRRHLCAVRYHLWHMLDDRVVAETTEEHVMRYFFPMELEYFLAQAGLALARLGAFPNIERDADETTWNVTVVARADSSSGTL
jgi:SAM-dependent methyltransferase